jgi:hypothetical protein
LTPSGSPCSGPSASPRITAASLACAVARAGLERARNHRIDGGIDRLDPVDATFHEFDRRKLALADQRPRRYRGQIARLAHVRITLP